MIATGSGGTDAGGDDGAQCAQSSPRVLTVNMVNNGSLRQAGCRISRIEGGIECDGGRGGSSGRSCSELASLRTAETVGPWIQRGCLFPNHHLLLPRRRHTRTWRPNVPCLLLGTPCAYAQPHSLLVLVAPEDWPLGLGVLPVAQAGNFGKVRTMVRYLESIDHALRGNRSPIGRLS